MRGGYQLLKEVHLQRALLDLLLPKLKQILADRAAGHCMRLADLDMSLMIKLTQALREQVDNAQVYILKQESLATQESLLHQDLFVSATKLVELRNPLPDGRLRPPLLLFLPFNLRTSAEDSFGVATFEELVVSDVYSQLVSSSLQRIPVSLQGHTRDILRLLTQENWSWADAVAQARYLLAVIQNGIDGESLGAALYELGLIPDFHLFDDPTIVTGRIQKNLNAVQNITDSEQSLLGRILQLGLKDKLLQSKLAELIRTVGAEDPGLWTRHIVSNQAYWDISFDKWQFHDEEEPDKIIIHSVQTDAPLVSENEDNPRLQGLIGQPVLSPKSRKNLKVTFQVEPHPSKIKGLDRFSVQIISVNGGPVGAVKNVNIWKSNALKKTINLTKLNQVGFEEGWHFARILAWTEDGDPIPLQTNTTKDTDKPSHESEQFFVVLDEDFIEEAPEQRTIPREYSLTHAKLRMQFNALLNDRNPNDVEVNLVNWADQSGRRLAESKLLVKFPRLGLVNIPVPSTLRQIEQHILNSKTHPSSWRLEVGIGQVKLPPIEVKADWPRSAASDSFVAARQKYFETLSGTSGHLVTQAADFTKLRDVCIEYAQSYLDLLMDLRRRIEHSGGKEQHQAINQLRGILAVDTVHLRISDYMGHSHEAILLTPVHPLRVIWLASWAHISHYWLSSVKEGLKDYIVPVRDNAVDRLAPFNIPAFASLLDGRIFTHIDSIHPFWSLYAPATEGNARGLLSNVCSALGTPEPNIGGITITGEVLASRIERYLLQHPYIQTLSINVFNPGKSTVLASALIQLQKHQAFSGLHYDIRFFLPNPEAPDVGEAIEQLIAPSDTISSVEVDAFSMSTGSHLFPKLSFALHPIEDFHQNPEFYRSHLTILFDLFPAEEIGISKPLHKTTISPLYGLIQDFATDFQDDDAGTVWRRQPIFGRPSLLSGLEDLTELLSSLSSSVSNALATVAAGTPVFEQQPLMTTTLDADQRELIHYVHDVSDWVFTIDRNIGIEFYDHGRTEERPDYIIDYIPGTNPEAGYRFIVTSRSLTELEAMLQPILNRYGLSAEGKHVAEIVQQLRALSGRVSMKLLSSPTQQAEALGLALARLFLAYQNVLRNQIVVPLDDHLYLFSTAYKQALEIDQPEAASLQRTDLALFDLNALERTITCNLVEVKCYASVGNLTAFEVLKESIAKQINQSESVLNQHFNPHFKHPDRPDRLLKTLELRKMLEFYLERSIRFGTMDEEAAQEARALLLDLEEDYVIRFTRSALIFDFEKPGTELPDYEYGIEYHRIGVDLIHNLIAEAKPVSTEETGGLIQDPYTDSVIPRLTTAAFIPPARERTVSLSETKTIDTSIGVEEPQQTNGRTLGKSSRDEGQTEVTNAITDAESVESPQPESEPELAVDNATSLPFDVVLGIRRLETPQYGLLGEVAGRKVALDLNQTNTISLFGVQGSGKSYTLGSIIEMSCLPIQNINQLPSPLATIVFHYSQTQEYKPEFTSMVHPNSDANQLASLKERYGAEPSNLSDVVLLTPASKIALRKEEYPNINVLPISFAASELQASHWKFLMGAVGSQSMYLRQINLLLRRLRNSLTLEALTAGVEQSSLSDYLKELALTRLEFAGEYIDDSRRLAEIVKPGRLVIVDLRDEFIEKDEALGLFVVLLQIFSAAKYAGQSFNKLVVFDEAHKYLENQDLIAGLVEVVREMRHKGTNILVASQDPNSVPVALIELSSQIILHRFNSPAWLKHIQKANAALNGLTSEKLSRLGAGEAYVWSNKATDDSFTKGAMKIRCRPRVTQHGGTTKTAV